MLLTWIFGSIISILLGACTYFLWRISQNTLAIFNIIYDIYDGLDAMFGEAEGEKSDVEKAVDDILNPKNKKKDKDLNDENDE